MEVSQVVLTLGGMAAGTVAFIKIVDSFAGRRKCDCSRSPDIERLSSRVEACERDAKRTWETIPDLYGKIEKFSELHHAVDKAVAKIIAKLEK